MKCNPEKLVTAMSKNLTYRDRASLLDHHGEIWDGTRVGDRIYITDTEGAVWIVVGSPWDSEDDLWDEYDGMEMG